MTNDKRNYAIKIYLNDEELKQLDVLKQHYKRNFAFEVNNAAITRIALRFLYNNININVK